MLAAHPCCDTACTVAVRPVGSVDKVKWMLDPYSGRVTTAGPGMMVVTVSASKDPAEGFPCNSRPAAGGSSARSAATPPGDWSGM